MILTSRRRIYAGEAKDHCAGTCGVCPTQMPTVNPTPQPTDDTTMEPTEAPLTSTTPQPIDDTTMEPTEEPTENPMSTTATPEPTAVATPYPSMVPTSEPTEARPCIGIKWKDTKCEKSCGNTRRKCHKKCASYCSQSCVCNLPSTTEAKSCASMGKGWNDQKCNAQCTRLSNCPRACRKKCSSGCTCNASRRLIQAPDEYRSGKFV